MAKIFNEQIKDKIEITKEQFWSSNIMFDNRCSMEKCIVGYINNVPVVIKNNGKNT